MNAVLWVKRLLFVLVISFTVMSCSKSAETDVAEAGLLQYVPADTPYLFAHTEPLPDDVLEAMAPGIDSALIAYGNLLKAVINTEIQKPDEDSDVSGELLATIEAVTNELAALLTLDGLKSAGIDGQSTMVMYGEGLLPVFRIKLTDGALMEQTIARIEDRAGLQMATGTIGGQAYRYAGDEDAQLILAVVEDDLVVTMVPTVRTDALLKSLLGLSKPAESIAKSGKVARILKENGFEPYYMMFVDITQLASTFLDEPTGSNAELLALGDYDSADLSDICKEEFREIAGIVPRIIAGYTTINTKEISSNFIVELRQDIAAGVAALTAPVQGLGLTKGGLFSFGMSIDLVAARDFYSARLDAMEADPFECEELAELQASVAQGRELLKQPIPPIAYSVKGFFAVVDAMDGMDIAAQQPPTSADASFLLATDNPQGLVAMGAMFSPELAALDLQADGKPQKLQLPPMSPALEEAHIAMTENSLVISIGEGGADRIVALLKKDYAEPPPFMSMSFDADQYYGVMADSMEFGQFGQSEDSETSPEITAAMSELNLAMQGWFGTVSFSVNFTDRGVEIPSTVTIADDE